MQKRLALMIVLLIAMVACGGRNPPVARPTPPPPDVPTTAAARPPAPPEPVAEPVVVPPEPVREDSISSATLDDLNRNSPLKPVFFELDSSEISPTSQMVLDENAAQMRRCLQHGEQRRSDRGHL